MTLQLQKPLAFFDLETTGIDPSQDRIVEISVLRWLPGGEQDSRTRRINPERPIPPASTAIHGIRDEDVRDEPPFRRIARGLLDYLADADLAGFNVQRFDIPLLENEFQACGLTLGLENRRVIDVLKIFKRMERRNLSAAVELYLGREHVGAHGAQADTEATADVFRAQLERYDVLPRSVPELAEWISPTVPDAVDRRGRFVRRLEGVAFGFGKYRNRPLAEVAREDADYLQWLLGQDDFPGDARRLVLDALRDAGGPSDQST